MARTVNAVEERRAIATDASTADRQTAWENDTMKAIWNGCVIAESATWEKLEGNVYFPPAALRRDYVRPSSHTSHCPWKGIARYYDVVVGDQVNAAAAWYYPDPKPAARMIKDHVGFWKGVTVTE
jgi:uncharacterized protein (DUF427 family)